MRHLWDFRLAHMYFYSVSSMFHLTLVCARVNGSHSIAMEFISTVFVSIETWHQTVVIECVPGTHIRQMNQIIKSIREQKCPTEQQTVFWRMLWLIFYSLNSSYELYLWSRRRMDHPRICLFKSIFSHVTLCKAGIIMICLLIHIFQLRHHL